MNSAPMAFHKIWIEQCAAAENIRENFGLHGALDYLVGQKLFAFLHAAERDPLFAAEVPAFICEIRQLFSTKEVTDYLVGLEHSKTARKALLWRRPPLNCRLGERGRP